MAVLKEWTQIEIDALYATTDDMGPRGGLQIMTAGEVMEMCVNPQEKMCGEFEIETLRRHRKIRRRGRARPGKGQMNLNLKQRDDR